MKYMGSKAKIAEFIVPIIQSHIAVSGSRTYIEPFCGGCNVIDKVQEKNRIAADKNEYLIALFKHIRVTSTGGLYSSLGKRGRSNYESKRTFQSNRKIIRLRGLRE